jgi:hypothetical protein
MAVATVSPVSLQKHTKKANPLFAQIHRPLCLSPARLEDSHKCVSHNLHFLLQNVIAVEFKCSKLTTKDHKDPQSRCEDLPPLVERNSKSLTAAKTIK